MTVKRVGDFRAWLEQAASIHAKAVSPHGDPIELSADEARRVAQVLIELADELDRLDEA